MAIQFNDSVSFRFAVISLLFFSSLKVVELVVWLDFPFDVDFLGCSTLE